MILYSAKIYSFEWPEHTDRFFVVSSSEKNRSEGPIFIGLSKRARTDFCIADKKSDLPSDFYRSVIWHTRTDFYRRQGPIVGLRHSDFCRTEVSAHGPIF